MSLSSSVQKFIIRFKQLLFYYQDGFYILPYLANSPQATIASLKVMPFVKMFPEANFMRTSNLFFEGDFHYEELEEDLWLLISNTKYKKNVSYNLIYDKTLPASYYTLSFYLHKTKRSSQPSLINNGVNIDRTWLLFKPGSDAINGHFAGSESVFLTINFSESWLNKNSKLSGLFGDGKLKKWLESDDDCLFIPELFDGVNHASKPILDMILNKGDKGVEDILKLKILTLELIYLFINRLKDTGVKNPYFVPTNQNRRKILKAEKMLSDAVFEGFPGIQKIASDVGISATKLKNDFKTTHGKSLFKYYQYKQMVIARNMLIKDPNLKINYIANVLGYVNVSKFSAAFRNCFGYLPSQISEKNTN